MSQTVYIVLAEGFEEIEAIVPVDVLRRAGFAVTTVGLAGGQVKGSHGMVLTADRVWEDVAESTPDVLVLPGGMPGSKTLGEHDGLRTMAGRVAEANGYLAAICAAPAFTLAAWGMLEYRNATCYPGCEAQSPEGANWKSEPVVVDDRVVTAKGPGVALDFAFALVEMLSGADASKELKAQMQCPT